MKIELKGIRAFISDISLKKHFEVIREEWTYIRYGSRKGQRGLIKEVTKLYKSVPKKGFYVGCGALVWLIKHANDLSIDLSDKTPKGRVLEKTPDPKVPQCSLLVPEAMSSSPKFKVKGKDRFYFYEAIEACRANPCGNIKLPTGCLAKGTKVIMYDGTTKKVEDVKVGDLLMGPDSTPRKVLRLCRGYSSSMYKVSPKKGGDPFVCNDEHILSLKVTKGAKDKRYPDGSLCNLPIRDYLSKPKSIKHILKSWRVGVEFPSKELEYDPYLVGIYLGDGTKKACSITTGNHDLEVISFIEDWAKSNDLHINEEIEEGKDCITRHFSYKKARKNPFREFVKTLITPENERYIPDHYLINSRDNRLKLLAGLLDSDGSMNGNCFDFVAKDQKFAKQVQFLARSLGFSCNLSCCEKKIKKRDFSGVYYRLNISGNTDEIPCLLSRKKATKREQKKDNKVTGFNVQELEGDNYYGFQVNKDNLYLLEDFTVTHNSGKGEILLTLAWNQLLQVGEGLILAPTLGIKEQLLERSVRYNIPAEEYEKGKIFPKGKIIVCTHHALVESLKNKEQKKQTEEFLSNVKWVIADECFPFHQRIETSEGRIPIGTLYNKSRKGESLPLAKSWDEKSKKFVYKPILKVFKNQDKDSLLQIKTSRLKTKCTPNHEFLTTKGWVQARNLSPGDVILGTPGESSRAQLLGYVIEEVEEVSYTRKGQEGYGLFDLEVKDTHNYLVVSKLGSGLIAHNCHHASCSSWFTLLMSLPNCVRSHGFSALPVNSLTDTANSFDEMEPEDAKVISVLGPVIYQKGASDLEEFLNLPYLINWTYKWPKNAVEESMQYAKDWHLARKAIIKNKERTKLIAAILDWLVERNFKIATFVNQKDHARQILNYCDNNNTLCWFGGGEAFDKTGQVNVDYIRKNFGEDIKCIILTSHGIEGLDFSNPINVLLLTEGKNERQTGQKTGRIVRLDDNFSMVINLCDENCNIFPRHARERSKNITKEFNCKPVKCKDFSELEEIIQLIDENSLEK